MIIVKHLKHVSFQYNFGSNELYVSKDWLKRSEMFSLMRFIVRIAQKGKPRK